MSKNPLKYSNVWEDAYLLGKGLNVSSEDKVMSIASGGDNSLYLLSFQPKEMLCLDMNEVQLHITRLKEEAIRHLPYSSFLELLGFTSSSQRFELFETLKKYLPKESLAFFSLHHNWIENGLIHEGKFEKYFKLFANRVLPFVHSQKVVSELLAPKSLEEQETFYNNRWNSWRWKLLFRFFFSKLVMGRVGREPAKLKEVEVSVGSFIYHQAEKHLRSTACQKNYILQYALTGHFGSLLPPYAEKEAFDKIKSWLQSNRVTYFQGNLEECLSVHQGFTRFNLSNIFEYMPSPLFHQNVESLKANSAEHARFAYWNLMVPRLFDEVEGFDSQPVSDVDLGFFYRQFYIYTRTS